MRTHASLAFPSCYRASGAGGLSRPAFLVTALDARRAKTKTPVDQWPPGFGNPACS